MDSSSFPEHKTASRIIDSRQAGIWQLYLSIMATKDRKPLAIVTWLISVAHAWLGGIMSRLFSRYQPGAPGGVVMGGEECLFLAEATTLRRPDLRSK
jgi:hypothetical protein